MEVLKKYAESQKKVDEYNRMLDKHPEEEGEWQKKLEEAKEIADKYKQKLEESHECWEQWKRRARHYQLEREQILEGHLNRELRVVSHNIAQRQKRCRKRHGHLIDFTILIVVYVMFSLQTRLRT